MQLSLQDVRADATARIAGLDCLERKLAFAGWVRELELPLTLNVVLHRDNLARVPEIVALARRLGADRLDHQWTRTSRFLS